jgi:CRISPR-associated protein Csb2
VLTLSIEFLAGRYHATSWDHHVNEGLVEWPPSPWRLVRALVAASYKLVPAVPVEDLRRVIEPLVSDPSYAVPAATTAHTRHYMPTDDKPTMVFDAFVAPAESLEIQWPDVEFGHAEAGVFDRLLAALTYLGRAESWIEARRTASLTRVANCVPSVDGRLELWAAERPNDYTVWKQRWDQEQMQIQRKQRRTVPADWWEVLHLGTSQLFKDGWSRPPGTRRARYRFEPAEAARRRRTRSAAPPAAARFELSSAVLPRLTAALPVGDRVRMALLARSDGHPVFVGRDARGEIERGHPHAWYLPADDDADGVLDHVVVYARTGFDARALLALEGIRRVWGHGGHDLELTLVALGSSEELGCLRREARTRSLAPQLGSARVWESHTPFVPPRHVKVRGGQLRETPVDQVVRLLQLHAFPTGVVEMIAPRALTPPRPPTPIEWYRFRRIRANGGGRRGTSSGYGVRIRFEKEVTGPLALGYAAHQGLGQFVAIE